MLVSACTPNAAGGNAVCTPDIEVDYDSVDSGLAQSADAYV